MNDIEITKEIATKVLDVVDAGLVSGMGIAVPGKMCVEAAVCFALGLPHSDNPPCVARALRSLKIVLNDASWSSDQARAKGMRRVALAQLGTAGTLNQVEFAKRVSRMVVTDILPEALRRAADIHPDEEHKLALRAAANLCEHEGTAESAWLAATAATTAWSAWSEAESAWSAATAAWTAWSAAESAESARSARSAAWSAAESARSAAESAESAATAGDQVLSEFAENIVQILIEMEAPGTGWLSLTEEHIA